MKYLILVQTILFSSPIFGQSNDLRIADRFKSENFDCAIFPKEYGDFIFIDGRRFTPTREEVKLAEEALQKDLKKINHQLDNQDGTKYNPIIHQNLKSYKRQYFGCIDEDGNKILLINAFWSKEENPDDWLNAGILVLDGGSHYWSIKYNIDKHKLFELQVNGNA